MNEPDDFILHISNQFKNEILKPKVGEIILLYQNIRGKGKAFTHLVIPVNNIKEDTKRENFSFGRKVQTIALADNDNFIYIQDTIWKNVDFKLISRGGHIYGIEKLDNYEDLVYDIWSKFTPFFTSNYLKLGSLLEINFHNLEQYDDIGVQEGEENLIKHIIRERNSKKVEEKKRKALEEESLRCSICTFSFIETFGVKFIECHHIKPIAEAGTLITSLRDLELVCPNCHKMLHKKHDGKYSTINELRELLANRPPCNSLMEK